MAVAIASPDKDFFQLLRPGLVLLRPPKKPAPGTPPARASKYALLPYTEADFAEEWGGLSPAQFIDLLALAGDASDNVPGVPGVGPKTATALLRAHGDLEGVLAAAAAGGAKPPRAAAALASPEGAAAARLSRQLVEIRTGLDLPPAQAPLAEFRVGGPPADGGREARRLLEDLEFGVHAARLAALWAAQGGGR
jgi:5'-3' exonuclease